MKSLIKNPIVIIILRLILGGIFIYASIDKIANPHEFAKNISHYHLVPFGLENIISIFLPWLELIIGVGLIVGFMVDGSVVLSMSLLVMFIVAISSAILRGYNIDCGCGLKEGQLVGTQKLLENSLLFISGLLILNRKYRNFEIFTKSD